MRPFPDDLFVIKSVSNLPNSFENLVTSAQDSYAKVFVISTRCLQCQYAIVLRDNFHCFTHLALSNVADSVFPIAPKLTPTARPSGILWTVIAITSRMIRFHWAIAFWWFKACWLAVYVACLIRTTEFYQINSLNGPIIWAFTCSLLSLFFLLRRDVTPCWTFRQSAKLSIPIVVESPLPFDTLLYCACTRFWYSMLLSVSSIAMSILSLLECVNAGKENGIFNLSAGSSFKPDEL